MHIICIYGPHILLTKGWGGVVAPLLMSNKYILIARIGNLVYHFMGSYFFLNIRSTNSIYTPSFFLTLHTRNIHTKNHM